jgi:hypothetical protein
MFIAVALLNFFLLCVFHVNIFVIISTPCAYLFHTWRHMCTPCFAPGVTEESIAEACAEFASDDEVAVKLGNLASMQAAFFDKSEAGGSFQVCIVLRFCISGRV